MGFYYFILLLIGILMAIGGLFYWKRSRMASGMISLFGLLSIVFSIFLFQPESSEIIAHLIGLD